MKENTIQNATVDILKLNNLTQIYIHANIEEQTSMPNKSGKTVQHCPDASYSWATLNYKISDNITLFLR